MWIKHKEHLNHYHTHKAMKGVEVEEFRDVEVYPDEELFVVVVRKNSKLRLDEDKLMEKLEPWTNRLQLRLEDESSSL
ncbi:hypothetical protein Taro_002114 [Colocasia esculenta]|uniref:Uncharacterized protein n=1 Tax=Colocasia esculenta TaxID=4460 RepID=A0A843TFJ6_COLES|nr:hypothetical protein [Colocasia esculenta]